jgi:AraC-like DNA-binding protein
MRPQSTDRLQIRFIDPRPELAPLIERFWVLQSADGLPAGRTNVVAPNGCTKLVIPVSNCIDSASSKGEGRSRPGELYFVGNQDSPTTLNTAPGRTQFITIEFKPHGAFPLFGIPMHELANILCPADAAFAGWGARARSILREAVEVDSKVVAIQQQLAMALDRAAPVNPLVGHCVQLLQRSSGLLPIAELARRTGYTRRRLQMLFKQQVGLSPKALAGIARFQRFHHLWARGTGYEQIRAELDAFYYDQSHFTREFKRLTGFPPRRYMQQINSEFCRRIAWR